MRKALAGETPLPQETAAYQSLLMDFLGKEYAARGFTMQLHLGALRNLNTRRFQALGPDVGCDSIGDGIPAASLAALLDRLAVRDALPKSILYTLNASDNEKLIAAAGCFHDGATAGKVQFGSAWWFNDHLDGMEKQLRDLANIGVLSRFVGMLTDSRSFLSYPRHESSAAFCAASSAAGWRTARPPRTTSCWAPWCRISAFTTWQTSLVSRAEPKAPFRKEQLT